MNKKTLIISSLIILTGLIIGITYAWFTWNSDESETTVLNIKVEGAEIIYDGGTDITGTSLYPTSTKEEGILKEVTMSLGNSTINVCADLNLELTTLPTELQHESFRYEAYKDNQLIGEGTFKDYQEGDVIKLGTSQEVTSVTSTYKIYIWIDGTMSNPLEMGGKSFSFNLNANAVDSELCNPSVITYAPWVIADRNNHGSDGANEPDLFEGMIPIRYEGETTDEWYNYDNKKWANAIMVTSETREKYMNAEVDSKILEEDILAYFVWIPRYRY